MTPAMLASWIFGLGLVWFRGTDWDDAIWLGLKLGLVIGLTVFHGYLGKTVAGFVSDVNVRSARCFRLMNEVPTVLMVVIVLAVVVKF